MTKSTEIERAELIAERAELMAKNEAATSWGAAVGARHERIKEIDRQLAALHPSAQDQKPVVYDNCPTCNLGWQLFPPTKINNVDAVQCVECKAVYPLSPPPAAGWDEAIKACKGIAKQHIEEIIKNSLNGEWVAQGILDQIESLRHNAPPDTPAGKSAPLEPRGCPTPGACSCPSVTPDHGGADEGVRDLLSLVLDELLQHNKEYSHVTKPEVFDKIEKALSHQPAPVAANASAEARLRNHLGIVLSALRMHEEATGESFDDEGGDIAQIEREYNSTHPHASDCDKQESDCGATRCRDLGCFGVCGDETMKSEGGSRKQPFDPADAAGVKSGTVTFDGQTGRPNRDEVGASQTPGSSMSFAADKPIIAGQAPGPSDRTADVKCEACSGTGRHMGRFSMNDPDCTYCNGKGKVLAGDCDKQGDAPKAEFITGYFTDQYKAGAKPPVGPSDRAADVTVEDIALVLLDGLKAGKAPIQIARDVRRAFTVGMR